MLIPITHEQMTVQRLPWITILVIVANVFIFLITHQQSVREGGRLFGVMEELQAFAERNPGMARDDFPSEDSLAEYQRLVEKFEEINQFARIDNYLAGSSHAPDKTPTPGREAGVRQDIAVRPTAGVE